MRATIVIMSLLPILLLAAPASALTTKQKMETCKVGADDQKLSGAKRTTFIARCMAKGDVKRSSAKTTTAPPSTLTRKQKMETCKFGADDQKLTGAKRTTFIARCMANEPRKKTVAKKPALPAPPPNPQ